MTCCRASLGADYGVSCPEMMPVATTWMEDWSAGERAGFSCLSDKGFAAGGFKVVWCALRLRKVSPGVDARKLPSLQIAELPSTS